MTGLGRRMWRESRAGATGFRVPGSRFRVPSTGLRALPAELGARPGESVQPTRSRLAPGLGNPVFLLPPLPLSLLSASNPFSTQLQSTFPTQKRPAAALLGDAKGLEGGPGVGGAGSLTGAGGSGPEALVSPWQRLEGKPSLQLSLLCGQAESPGFPPTAVLHWDSGPTPACWGGGVSGGVPERQTSTSSLR